MSGLLGKPYIGRPLSHRLSGLPLPLLADIPGIGRVLFFQDPLFYLSLLTGLVLWVLLRRTRWGIATRSVGENPAAAEVQGISVGAVRYLCTIVGGAMAGATGAHLSLVYSKSWNEGLTGGRGWIAIVLLLGGLGRERRRLSAPAGLGDAYSKGER